MSQSLRSGRVVVVGLSMAALLVACQITGAWHYVNDADLLSHPAPRHSAVTRNHEFILSQQLIDNSLELFGTNGAHVDTVPLGGMWRSMANATYRGPKIEVDGREVDREAFLVLHANGWIIPWYHSRGQLTTAPFPHWVKMPPRDRDLDSRSFLDIDQHADGTIYVLGSARPQGAGSHGRLWQRSPAGDWSHVDKGADGEFLYKVTAVAVDKQVGRVAVASEPVGHKVHVDVYETDLTPKEQRIRENTRSLVDMDYFLGHFYLGVNTVVGPGDYKFEIEIRNGAWGVTHQRDVARVEAISLDLPGLPVSSKNYHNVFLWSTGADENPGDGDFYYIHEYELRP